MNKRVLAFGLAVVGMALAWQALRAQERMNAPASSCDTSCCDAEQMRCKPACEIKHVKRWVYSIKEEPFCLRNPCSCLGIGPCCRGPFIRTLLVKRPVIEEKQIMKCVVENTVERVPCQVPLCASVKKPALGLPCAWTPK